MNWKVNKGLVLLLGLIFLALIVTPVVSAEDINTDSGTISIAGNQYWVYHIHLPNGGGIKYTIKANDSVNVYLLDDINFQRYANGQNFNYIDGGSALDVQSVSIQYAVNKSAGGIYHLVVESATSRPVEFTWDVAYGEDVELSVWEFFNGMSKTMCIISALIFFIWLGILVWVYKDAKRRGKSGLLWFFIVLIFNILGLLIWLIVRPKNRIQ